jgi:hypothetical protein
MNCSDSPRAPDAIRLYRFHVIDECFDGSCSERIEWWTEDGLVVASEVKPYPAAPSTPEEER